MWQQHVVAVTSMFVAAALLLLLLAAAAWLFQLSVIIHSAVTFESFPKKFDSLHANAPAVAAIELLLQVATDDRMCLSKGNHQPQLHPPPSPS